ncbi:MAG: DUF6567 family protein [Limisphaerales bacterium]
MTKKPNVETGFKFMAGLALVVMLGGCAGTAAAPLLSGLLGTSPLDLRNQTSVQLSEGNFVLVKTNVMGQSRGFALLGIITIVPAEFNTAFSRLYSQAGMESGKSQTLADISVEKSGSYWILFSLPRCTVRADVVEFVPPTRTNSVAGSPH